MSLIFNFENENNKNKSQVRVTIDDKQLLVEFIPASNSAEDLQTAATKRDRFNFCISYMLHQAIESKIHYEENLDLTKLSLDGFSVLLQFNQKVDFELIKSIFISDTFTVSYFSEFFSEDNRQEIISQSELYFDRQDISLEATPENQVEKVESGPIPTVLLSDNQYDEEMNLPLPATTIPISKERIQQLKNIEDDGTDFFNHCQTVATKCAEQKQELQKLKKFVLHEDEEIIQSGMLTKCDEMIAKTNEMLKELDEQLQKKIIAVEEVAISEDREEDEELISIVELSSVQPKTFLCQTLSVELLEKNIKEAEPVLIYATLGNQLKVRQKMKREGFELYDVYDDIFLNKSIFRLFKDDADLKQQIKDIPNKVTISDQYMDDLFKSIRKTN